MYQSMEPIDRAHAPSQLSIVYDYQPVSIPSYVIGDLLRGKDIFATPNTQLVRTNF